MLEREIFDVVMVFKIDRFSRSSKDFYAFKSILKQEVEGFFLLQRILTSVQKEGG